MSRRARVESYLNVSLAAQFQTALLISGNPLTAEDVLLTSIAEFDISDLDHESSRRRWRHAVVVKSIEASTPYPAASGMLAASILQPSLRPVLFIDPQPRICFVLRLLLGYSTDACARLLRIGKDDVGPLLANAVVQLREISKAGLLTQSQKEPSCQTTAGST